MALGEIRRIDIFAHNSLRERLPQDLQRMGIVQITDVKETLAQSEFEDLLLKEELKDEVLEKRRDELRYAINYIGDFEERKGFVEGFLKSKVVLDEKQFLDIVENFDYEKICKECQRLEWDIADLESRIDKLSSKYEELLPWEALDISLEDLGGTKETSIVLGMVKAQSFASMCKKVQESFHEVVIELINGTKTINYFLIVCMKRDEASISDILREFGFTQVNPVRNLSLTGSNGVKFEEQSGKLRDILKKISADIQRMKSKRGSLRERGKELVTTKFKLMAIHDHLSSLLERKRVQNYFAGSSQFFIMEGWIRRRDEKLIKELEKRYSEIEIRIRDPLDSEAPPIELENRPLVKPFEMVTNLYGLPHYREVDPSPFLAPFFALFFALCLTDAGYGLILALLAWVGLRKLPIGEGGKRLLRLLRLSGIVTIFIGLLTGGIFGIELERVPHQMGFLKKIMLFDPKKDFLIFLLLSLALGFIQVLVGFGVKIYKDVRVGKVKDAILDQLPWLMILPGIVLFGLVKAPQILLLGLVKGKILGESWNLLALALIALGAGMVLIFQGRESKNIFARIGIGLYGLYGITGYFGHILSYLRLFALGLATLGIALSVNMMARTVPAIPFLKPIAFIVIPIILVIGHLTNIAINSLSGFIHTLRLQFVEFFTKFYEGGGKLFKPFKEENEYTIIRGG